MTALTQGAAVAEDQMLQGCSVSMLADEMYDARTPPARIRLIEREFDRRATARLNELWDAFRVEHGHEAKGGYITPLSQREFVERFVNPRFNLRWCQSTFSQYLGGAKLGPRPLGLFCRVFGVRPCDIREEYRPRRLDDLRATIERTVEALSREHISPIQRLNLVNDLRGDLRALEA